MKKEIAAFIAGLIAATSVSVYAASVTATENTFKVTVNGTEANISGYNIGGSTYFKLRDVADAVGGLTVGFENNTITIVTNMPGAAGTGERPTGEMRVGTALSAEEMKSRLEQEVSAGKMTQAQADEILSQLESGTMLRGNPPQGAAPQN